MSTIPAATSMSTNPAARFVARCLVRRACVASLACVTCLVVAGGAVAATPTQRDVAYGSDPAERYDVYVPTEAERATARARHAPAVFFVHGGAWAHGDKAAPGLLDAKLARWLPLGYVVISVEYPLLPREHPLEQARDVAHALAHARAHASTFGADPRRFVVMGHSAGAHLVALIATSPAIARAAGMFPPAGYVLLDTAALDVASVMRSRHARLYDRAFGSVPQRWPEQSPLALLSGRGPPILAVCSTRRRTSCSEARAFVAKALSIGTAATLLEENLSHEEINRELGEPSTYTNAVDAFMRDCVTRVAPMR